MGDIWPKPQPLKEEDIPFSITESVFWIISRISTAIGIFIGMFAVPFLFIGQSYDLAIRNRRNKKRFERKYK